MDPVVKNVLAAAPGQPNWETSDSTLEIVRALFGRSIDLDPTTTASANMRVKAEHIITEGALDAPWPECETCYMNPPFSPSALARGLYERWSHEFFLGTFKQGVALRLLNGLNAKYTLKCLNSSDAFAIIPPYRLAFINPDTKELVRGGTHGIALLTLGVSEIRVKQVTRRIGGLLVRHQWWTTT